MISTIDHGVRAVLCILHSKSIENEQISKHQIREFRRQFCSPPVMTEDNEVGWEETEDSLLLEEEFEDEVNPPSTVIFLGFCGIYCVTQKINYQ